MSRRDSIWDAAQTKSNWLLRRRDGVFEREGVFNSFRGVEDFQPDHVAVAVVVEDHARFLFVALFDVGGETERTIRAELTLVVAPRALSAMGEMIF